MKILIIGHDGAGKDTVAKALAEQFSDLTYCLTSVVAAELIIMQSDEFKGEYADPYECYADRNDHRLAWADLISDYNKDDPAALAKQVLARADFYIGARKRREFEACKKLVDVVVWVEKPGVSTSAILEVSKSDADLTFVNSVDFETDPKMFSANIKKLYARIRQFANKPSEEEQALINVLNKPLKDNAAEKQERDETNSDYDL